MKIYGDLNSGNCLKVKWTCDLLKRSYQWVDIDITKGQSRTPEFLAQNPAGQVPLVVLDDGRPLAQSNAIIRFLAKGTPLIPADDYLAAKMDEWLFWEQYSHEPYIAVCRFVMVYLKKPPEARDPEKVKRGVTALKQMEDQLAKTPFLAGDALTLADISLLAYTRVAHEGGFDLADYPSLRRWIAASEKALGLSSLR